ncbi:uncharacterized protein LOC142327668 [Lycorma delicatula]|uniref:uncharacterized protein LOC142327668 n=1 Tax=Lycorma delicatula TaxID=130591 RepID=UPI003F518CD2
MCKTSFFLFCLLFLYDAYKTKAICTDINLELRVVNKGYLQINWEVDEVKEGDWIGILYGDIKFSHLRALRKNPKAFTVNVKNKKGTVYTKQMFIKKIDLYFKDASKLLITLVYWRKNLDGNEFKAFIMSHLSTYPNWMNYYREVIRDLPLNQIFIPGTFNSADPQYIEVPPELREIKKLLHFGVSETEHEKERRHWKERSINVSEDTSILQQLVLGIRYLDIRVVLSREGKFYVGNLKKYFLDMDSVINQVTEFLSKTKELVIFDVHVCTSGRLKFDHGKLVAYLKKKFLYNSKMYLVPRQPWTTKFSDILKDGSSGKVILSYNNEDVLKDSNFNILWDPVHHFCQEFRNISSLQNCLKNLYEDNDNKLANIAHAAVVNVLNIENDTNIPNYKEQEKPEKTLYEIFMKKEIGLKTNILITDDYMAMGTVRQAIRWNIGKYYFNSKYEYPDKTCIKFNINDDEYYQRIIR